MSVFATRLQKALAILSKNNIDAFVIQEPQNLKYLLGITVSLGSFLLSHKGSCLAVDGRYIAKAKATVSVPLIEAKNSQVKHALEHSGIDIKTLGFDSASTTVAAYENLKKDLPNIELVPVPHPLKSLRAIKSKEEIAALEKAAALGSEGFDVLCRLLKVGIKERDAAAELEYFWRKKGAQGPSFEPIVCFGANSASPHHRASDTALQQNSIVLFDIGVVLNDYISDMTRTVFFGTPDKKLKEIYLVTKRAQEAAFDACRAGVTCGALDTIARNIIKEAGYEKYFSHGLGHGIGLDVHEYPSLSNQGPNKDDPLCEGMAVTLEPGIYLDGLGGVRIEDSVLVTKEGCIDLTKRSKELRIID